MSKKFSKTILSSAVAGLMLVSSGAMAAEPEVINVGDGTQYQVKLYKNGEVAEVYDVKAGRQFLGAINTTTGSVSTVNNAEIKSAMELFLKENPSAVGQRQAVAQIIGEMHRYSINVPSFKLDNIDTLTVTDIESIKANVDAVSKVITSKTAADYNQAVSNGMSSEAALTVAKDGGAVLKEFNRIDSDIDQLNKDTTFAMDADGNITLDETAGTGERYGVKDVVAEVVEDTTVRVAEDGSLTTARNTQTTKRVNEAVVDLDKSVRTNSQDIATNRKAIQSNSRQLQEHNARLNDHQRQIRENHEEMKRAAAQSAALAGLFQPYSVGKFNATAALGGYSDKQAVAVGVGYRFNEQTAAKAGIAASDGDVSYNVGVNFEF
ncbi:YadA C-terminal domain-containing protein [Escherichia coli]|uniref:YadA C-terminal domain-containing protein n=4 Tax=Escherichia coli TaxID=562 RepID=UPI00022435F0|nr:YadA C-terminal domain-containing protein [Escherichia coli]HDQ6976066.1 YadA-like family protein [Escherichia coli O166:H28]EEC7393005.1 hypothetical protein [Escherichia coli]EEC8235694.1 hypothetical protein [Escherichia coli]EEC8353102.1 hypothetical protein [Escherichia coli]EEC8403453.1 hypothetical protein [Escherichia coli]